MSGYPVGHSTPNLETLSQKHVGPTTHFGFFPKAETRPGAITPAYVTPRVFRSARNVNREERSDKSKEGPKRNIHDQEVKVNYSTLPRGWKAKNKSSGDSENCQKRNSRCKYYC